MWNADELIYRVQDYILLLNLVAGTRNQEDLIYKKKQTKKNWGFHTSFILLACHINAFERRDNV